MRVLLMLAVLPLVFLALSGCGDGDAEQTIEEVGRFVEEAGLGVGKAPAETASGDEDIPDAYTGRYVYVTEHGKRYHAPYCQHVRGKQGLTGLTRDDAVLAGYEPCKVCNPGPPR